MIRSLSDPAAPLSSRRGIDLSSLLSCGALAAFQAHPAAGQASSTSGRPSLGSERASNSNSGLLLRASDGVSHSDCDRDTPLQGPDEGLMERWPRAELEQTCGVALR